jgi:chemotaxis receptor (MCP) glutamine deamidase CheD
MQHARDQRLVREAIRLSSKDLDAIQKRALAETPANGKVAVEKHSGRHQRVLDVQENV